MRPEDFQCVANVASTEYFDSDLNAFLCPHRHEYPHHVVRRFAQMIQKRYLNPRNISFVAVDLSSDDPERPIGYAQFIRLGDDRAAHNVKAMRNTIWLTIWRWWWTAKTSIINFISPDRSADPSACAQFYKSTDEDDAKYWDSPEMKLKYENRWYAQSVVVSSSFHRKGIGRALMEQVLQRAQEENVVVSLEASEDGEKLYRALGFELRGRFSMNFGVPVGGIMMWTPKGYE